MFSPRNRIALRPDDILAVVASEKQLHPQLEWEDIYKLLNQAWYGPTHITRDRKLIIASIDQEYKTMQSSTNPVIQDIGNGKGYVRLNLSFIGLARSRAYQKKRDAQILPITKFIAAFTDMVLASCLPKQPNHSRWLRDYEASVALLANEGIIDFPLIDTWQQGIMDTAGMPSHSLRYKLLYKPHYRVVHYKTLLSFMNSNHIKEEILCL